MPGLLIDSDAWLCLRHLTWLPALIGCEIPLRMAERAFRIELNALRRELDVLESSGRLVVVSVFKGTPAYQAFRQWTRREGMDPGEAEAIAWEVHRAPTARTDAPMILVSNDRGARDMAKREKLAVFDVFSLLVWGALNGHWRVDAAQACIRHWEDDPHAGFCRPKDFTTVEASWAARERQLRG